METQQPSVPIEALPSPRKLNLIAAFERLAPNIGKWRDRNRYFHDEDMRFLRFLIGANRRVLELGCGNGELLAGLAPSAGFGVDFSPAMIEIARRSHPELTFHVGDIENPAFMASLSGEPYDVLLLSDTIGYLDDIQRTFALIRQLCSTDTRVVLTYYSQLWEPIVRLAEKLGLKSPTSAVNWLSTNDIRAILALVDFEEVKQEWRQLLPKLCLGLGPLLNRTIATLPLLRRLCVRNYLVFRSVRQVEDKQPSVSVVVPCRNERGNIEGVIRRIPRIAPWQEVIFVEGHSRDGTLEEVHRVAAANSHLNIKVLVQDGNGKGDAVRRGFEAASGEVLMILDADLSVPPEELPKFYDQLASGRGEFANGSRLVYPIESQAMRFLNLLANNLFAVIFTFLLNQRMTDSLCGTKALFRRHYREIVDGRSYFGDFDPFGDFDLILGAAKLNLKFVEIPIRYSARTYGTTQISRFRHGVLLFRMVAFAWWKLKAV